MLEKKDVATPEKKGIPEKKGTPVAAEKAAPEKKPNTTDKNTKPADAGLTQKKEVVVSLSEKKAAPAGKQPNFSQTPGDVSVVEGQRLHLQCQVTSDPTATITWSLDGKVIKPSKFIILSQEGESWLPISAEQHDYKIISTQSKVVVFFSPKNASVSVLQG